MQHKPRLQQSPSQRKENQGRHGRHAGLPGSPPSVHAITRSNEHNHTSSSARRRSGSPEHGRVTSRHSESRLPADSDIVTNLAASLNAVTKRNAELEAENEALRRNRPETFNDRRTAEIVASAVRETQKAVEERNYSREIRDLKDAFWNAEQEADHAHRNAKDATDDSTAWRRVVRDIFERGVSEGVFPGDVCKPKFTKEWSIRDWLEGSGRTDGDGKRRGPRGGGEYVKTDQTRWE